MTEDLKTQIERAYRVLRHVTDEEGLRRLRAYIAELEMALRTQSQVFRQPKPAA